MSSINVLLLGSTGSIGTQTLDIIRANPDKFRVSGLTANSNCTLLAEQIAEFRPPVAVIASEDKRAELIEKLAGRSPQTQILSGYDSVVDISRELSYDVLLNALVGFSGFRPTTEALKAGRKVALANKESLVVGGELLQKYTKDGISNLIPVDSEHSAILQCLIGEEGNAIEKLLITASGGPFRTLPLDQMAGITPERALKHPNWSMGAKITIDSATMMNKGLEIIEAYWLYHLPLHKIQAVIHPQSIIHSMVTFEDGSTKAQMGYPDMKVPIQYALTWPARIPLETPRMDFSTLRELTFEEVDFARYPCLKLALEAIDSGGFAPAVLNAANEIAVHRFLNREIPYIGIPKIVSEALLSVQPDSDITMEALVAADEETRAFAAQLSI
ncbi:1-deoxy-D-xylulose-5-phosphate reductoisomerase [Cyclonatronum proteinivorum]|nr:1-deoxy-D-xylulose-5-phosphate reductoisomerase [Cyclonatronum proteinivorum]